MLRKAIATCGLVAAGTAASLIGASSALAQQEPPVVYSPTTYVPSTVYIPTTTYTRPIIAPERLGIIQEQMRSQERQNALQNQQTLERMQSQERQLALEHEKSIEQMRSQERQAALDRERVAEQLRSQVTQTRLENEKALERARSQSPQTTFVVPRRSPERQTIVSQGSGVVER